MIATERVESTASNGTERIEPRFNGGLVVFPRMVVRSIRAEANHTNIIKSERFLMGDYYHSTRDLLDRLVLLQLGEKANEGFSRAGGLALAHRVLRNASLAVGYRMPPLNENYTKDFEEYVSSAPGLLGDWFEQDYERHPAVLDLVNSLSNKHAKEGAMMLFALYGSLANPTRRSRDIPKRPDMPNLEGYKLPAYAAGWGKIGKPY